RQSMGERITKTFFRKIDCCSSKLSRFLFRRFQMHCDIHDSGPAAVSPFEMEIGSLDSQKNVKGFCVGLNRLNGSLQSDLRSIQWAREQLDHHGLQLLFTRRLFLYSKVAGAMPDFHITARNPDIQFVKPAVETVFGWIETQRVAYFCVGDGSAY